MACDCHHHWIFDNLSDPRVLAQTRRQFFGRAARGIGVAALASLLNRAAFAGEKDPLATRGVLPRLHFAPKAKRVIYLFQSGAPSQLDLFEPKPKLVEMTGQDMPESLTKGQRVAQLQGQKLICVGSKFKFEQHGQSGTWMSELLPHTAKIVDDLAFIRSLWQNAVNHDPAVTGINTGHELTGRPVMGSWLSYGLGSENDNLPAFIVLLSGAGGQPLLTRYWSSGFLPGSHQGVQLRSGADPVLFVKDPAGLGPQGRREILDGVRELNELRKEAVGDPEIATRIAAYEMAYRMQTSVPEVMDIAKEPQETLDLYGVKPGEASFAANCLLARRLIERGVRFVQLYHRDWDHHGNLPAAIANQCKLTDQASAALVTDLKRRGLLQDTLVIWGGEFGRTPMNQGTLAKDNYGRDHHSKCFTLWMAGGGIKGGASIGAGDEFGYNVAEDPVHVNDYQATVLHLLGVDHEKLTYKFQGRDYRLTDVHGKVLTKLLA